MVFHEIIATAQSPSEFLKNLIGKSVSVRLNSGVDYKGRLACLDGYMNIALEETVQIVPGSKDGGFVEYGDAFIRGNNGKLSYIYLFICIVLYISLA